MRHVPCEIFSFTVGVYVMNTLSKWAVFESILAEIRKCVVGDPLWWSPDGGKTCFGARNGLVGCLRVVSYEETCRRRVHLEIFNLTVGVYVMNTLSKWAYFGSQEGCPEARST